MLVSYPHAWWLIDSPCDVPFSLFWSFSWLDITSPLSTIAIRFSLWRHLPLYMDALTPQDRTHFKRGYSEIMQRRLHCTYLTIKVSFSSLSYVSSPPLVHLDVFDTEPTIFTPLCFSLTEDRLIITTEVPYTPSLEKSTTRHTSITETTNLLLSYGTPPTKWCRDLYNTIQYNTPSMHYFACRYIYVYYMMSLSSGTQCWFYTLHMCPHRAKEWNNEFEDKLWNDL